MKGTEHKSNRNNALDFTKGVLVLFMVLYHWMNYFLNVGSEAYRYLRFITPSFIFITGFLIASVYLISSRRREPSLARRLIQRGLKLLVLFTLLNLAIGLITPGKSGGAVTGAGSVLDTIRSVYLTGNGKLAAFMVLVPISYLLLFAGVFAFSGLSRAYLFLCFIILLICTSIFQLRGESNFNLELFTIGLLGASVGLLPARIIGRAVAYPYVILAAYCVYILGITFWGAVYPLQMFGVCLSLLLFYYLGIRSGDAGWMQRQMLLIGRYSLLGYIAQIAILQCLRMAFRRFDSGVGVLLTSLLGAFALTFCVIVLVDRARSRSSVADRMYKLVFA